MADEKEKLLKVKLEYVTDKQSTSTVKSGLADIQKALDDTTKRAAKLKAELDDMNNRGPKVKATLASLTKNLDNDLARSAERASVFSSRLEKVDRTAMALEATGRAFGGTWGSVLADVAGRVGDLAMAFEQVQKLGGLGGLSKLGGLGAGAGGGLAAGGIALAGVLGVGAGALGYEGLRKAGVAKGASLGQFASVGAYGAGKVFGDDTAKSWFETVAKWTGEIAEDAPKAEKTLKATSQTVKVLPSAIQNIIDQISSMGTRAATTAANSSTGAALGGGVSLPTGGMTIGSSSVARRNAAARAALQANTEQQNIEDQRLKIIKSAQREQLEAELDFQRERKQSIQSFNLEMKQSQQQHDLDMKRMRQDSQRQLTGLARQRDAVGYLQAWEENRINTKRAEQDFQLQKKQAKDSFNLQLAQDQQDFEAQQATRKRNAAAQLDDLQTSLSKENKVRQQGYDAALKQAKTFSSQLKGAFSGLSGDNINNQIARAFN